VIIGYLLDEHLPPSYRSQLLRREPVFSVWLVGDPGAPPRGTPDPSILAWCEETGFILVTRDRQSMSRHVADHLAAWRHIPGVLILSHGMTVGEVLDELLLVAVASDAREYQDLVIYLPME